LCFDALIDPDGSCIQHDSWQLLFHLSEFILDVANFWTYCNPTQSGTQIGGGCGVVGQVKVAPRWVFCVFVVKGARISLSSWTRFQGGLVFCFEKIGTETEAIKSDKKIHVDLTINWLISREIFCTFDF
jgi:hypothetical protein